MSKTVNKFYVTVNGVLEEDDLLVEVARLEDERDNALLERDEAVTKASDLAQELAGTLRTVEATREARERDWEALKSWNKVANEKHEETVKLKNQLKTVQARANFLSSALQARDAHIQELIAEYEKSIESLKSEQCKSSEDWEGLYYDKKRESDKIYQEMKLRGDAVQRQGQQIEKLRQECANKRSQIKGLQAELEESDRERNAWKTRALERQERVEGLVKELAEAAEYSDALLKEITTQAEEIGRLQLDVKFASNTADDWYKKYEALQAKYLELRKHG